MASALPPSSPPVRPWSRGTARAAAYRLRVLLGLALSLGAVTAAFRVPWGAGTPLVGWGAQRAEAFQVVLAPTDPAKVDPETDIVSRYRIEPAAGEAPVPAEEDKLAAHAAASTARTDEPAALLPEPQKVAPILEFAEEAPELTGGLGSLYIRIRYPQAAIDQGIEGQLVLKFIVEPDGRTSEIVVVKSLHPLCDSAAVRALREVAFVPGRQNGEAARVRMRLPVRFRLVTPRGSPPSDSSFSPAG